MADIEREAMDIQLHDKLLEYKQQMGMLGTGSGQSKQIGAGAGSEEKEPELLDQVIVNETEEMNRSN
jgi:hypothetical protein